MKTYIQKPGAHSILNGTTYKAGDAINTNIDLIRMWPNRFSLAPAGIKGTKWPEDVNDVVGTEKFAVICNRDRVSFRIVDAKGKTVTGCSSLSRKDAQAKYYELMGIEKGTKKAEKQAPVKQEPKPDTEDEEDSEEESEDKEEESEDKEEESEDKEEEDSEEEEEDSEEEEEDKPKKSKKSSKKSSKKHKSGK